MNQICAIVGFGAGNGLAIAKAFAAEGFALALISRSEAKQQKNIAALGAAARFFEADAANTQSLAAAFAKIRTEVGHPAVLIYNAFAMRMGRRRKLRWTISSLI